MIEYATFKDGTRISYEGFFEDGIQKVEILFERKRETARYTMPENRWLYIAGFSEKEIREFEEIADCMCADLVSEWFNYTQVWVPNIQI